MPPELRTAMAIARASSVSASRSIVMFPSGSAVVPRIDPDGDWKRLVEQVLLSSDGKQLDQIFGRARIDLASAEPRVDESAKADAGEMTRAVGGDIPEQMRDDALRQIVSFNLVADGQLLHLGHEAPVAADDTLERPSWPR